MDIRVQEKEGKKLSRYVRVSDSVKLLRYVQVLSTGTFCLRKFFRFWGNSVACVF